MRGKTRENEKAGGKVEKPHEGEENHDRYIIADAIFAGLSEIAGAIREVAKSLSVEGETVEDAGDFYLDGSRK